MRIERYGTKLNRKIPSVKNTHQGVVDGIELADITSVWN